MEIRRFPIRQPSRFAVSVLLILIMVCGSCGKHNSDLGSLPEPKATSDTETWPWQNFDWDEPFIDEENSRDGRSIDAAFSPFADDLDSSPSLTWPYQSEDYGRFYGIPALITTGVATDGNQQILAFDRMYLIDEDSQLYCFNPRSPGGNILEDDARYDLDNGGGYNMSSVVVSDALIPSVPPEPWEQTQNYLYVLDNAGGLHVFVDGGHTPDGQLIFAPKYELDASWDPATMASAFGWGDWDIANTSPAISDGGSNSADIVFSGHNSSGHGSLNCLKLRPQGFNQPAEPDNSSWAVSLAGAGGLGGTVNLAATPVIYNQLVYCVVSNYGTQSPPSIERAALVVYDLADGSLVDDVALPDGDWYANPSSGGAIQATPCFRFVGAADVIYVPSPNGVYSFDASSLAPKDFFAATAGHKIYSSAVPHYYSVIDGSPSVAHGIYVVENHVANTDWRVRFLVDDGLSGTTPVELWRSDYIDGSVKSQPLMDNENFYVVDNNELFAFIPFDYGTDTFNSSPDSPVYDSADLGEDLRSSPVFNGKDSNQMDFYAVYLATDETLSGANDYGQVHAFHTASLGTIYDVGGNVQVDGPDMGCTADSPGVGITVELEFEDGGSYHTTTDSNGDYHFGNVPAGSDATVRCLALDYEFHNPLAHSFVNLSADLLNLDFELTDDCCEDSWSMPTLEWQTWGLGGNTRNSRGPGDETAPDATVSNAVSGKISATPIIVKDGVHQLYAASSDGVLYEFEWSGSFLVADDVNTPISSPTSPDMLATAAANDLGLIFYSTGDTFYAYNPETNSEYAHYTIGGDYALSSVGCFNDPLSGGSTLFVVGSSSSGENDKLFCLSLTECGLRLNWEMEMGGKVVGGVHMPSVSVSMPGVVLVNTVDGSNQLTLHAISVPHQTVFWRESGLGTSVPHSTPFEVTGLWGVVTKEAVRLFEAPGSIPSTLPDGLTEYSLSPFNAPTSREITSPCAVWVIDNAPPTADDAYIYVQGQTSPSSTGFIIRYTLSSGTANTARSFGMIGMTPILAGTGAPALDEDGYLYVPGKNYVLTFDGITSTTKVFTSSNLGLIEGSVSLDQDGRFYVPVYYSGFSQSRLAAFGDW